MVERTSGVLGVMTQRDFEIGSVSTGFSGFETFFEGVKGGVLDSFALGPAIREGTARIAEGDDPTPLTEEQYRSSPFFREELPFDRRLTKERAAAFAEFIDIRKVREQKLQNTPGWVVKTLGSFVGQAFDPINYIPVLGPTARAASAARFGIVGGRAAVAAGDAALNTAIFGAVTAPLRIQQGRPVTIEELLLEVSTAAVIGSVFGSVGGVLSKRNIGIEKTALAEVEVATQNLEDGLSSFIETGEIDVRPETLVRVTAIADRQNPAATDLIPGRLVGEGPERFEGQRIPMETAIAPDVRVGAVDVPSLPSVTERSSTIDAARRAAPETFKEVEASKRLIATYRAWVLDIQDRVTDTNLLEIDAKIEERSGALLTATGRRAAKIRKEIEALIKKREETINASRELPEVKELRKLIAAEDIKLRDNAVEVSKAITKAERGVAGRAATVREIQRNLIDTTDTAATPLHEATTPEFNTPEALRAATIQRALRAPKTDGYAPGPAGPIEGVSMALPNVKAGVATTKQVADEFGIDVETGTFPEQDAFDVMDAQGRLTPEETKKFKEATDVVERTKNYADALKQAALCEVG